MRPITGQAAREYLENEFRTIGPFIQREYADLRPYTKTRLQAFRGAVDVTAARFNCSRRAIFNLVAPPVQMRGLRARQFLELNLVDAYRVAAAADRNIDREAAVQALADEFHISKRVARDWLRQRLINRDLPTTAIERNRALSRGVRL